jgi:biotin carboxyl carrier protein
MTSASVSEIKAPMPGLVLNIMVQEGDEVKKGDNLMILEAMKMENSIKSPIDGTVKNLKVATGDKLEKNQVMITFK